MHSDPQLASKAWRRAGRIRQLSDRLIPIGPWGLGLDGVLAWVPVAGTAYSVGAGALLLYDAIRVGASRSTIARMAVYLGLNSVLSGIPVVGWAADTLFTGHAMAAHALQKDIERRFGWAHRSQPAPPGAQPVTER